MDLFNSVKDKVDEKTFLEFCRQLVNTKYDKISYRDMRRISIKFYKKGLYLKLQEDKTIQKFVNEVTTRCEENGIDI